MNLNEKLQALRRARGYSQEDLAARLGVSRQAVSKWEQGLSTPDIDNLIALSDLYGVTLDSLLRDREEAPPAAAAQLPPLWRYEYKSRRHIGGVPLVHVHLGYGICRARGVIAVGNVARGVLAVGGFASGAVSFGGMSFGLLSLGGLSCGLIALGGLAVGALAVGGAAVGLLALGGAAAGMFSVGGAAVATHVAIGDAAVGHVAIGREAWGTRALTGVRFGDITPEQARALILGEYPRLPGALVRFLSGFFHG